jgi:hypothetical protein
MGYCMDVGLILDWKCKSTPANFVSERPLSPTPDTGPRPRRLPIIPAGTPAISNTYIMSSYPLTRRLTWHQLVGIFMSQPLPIRRLLCCEHIFSCHDRRKGGWDKGTVQYRSKKTPASILGIKVGRGLYFGTFRDYHFRYVSCACYSGIKQLRYPHVPTTTAQSSWNKQGTNTELSRKTVVGDFAHHGICNSALSHLSQRQIVTNKGRFL